MDKQIKWTPDYDFIMLSMFQVFTDKELQDLGMGEEDIIKFREYEKRSEEQKTGKPLPRKKKGHS